MRKISLTNYPDNVAVLDADSMFEAALKASDEMKSPDIQAALWLRKENGYNSLRDKRLKKHFGTVIKSRTGNPVNTSVAVNLNTNTNPNNDIRIGKAGGQSISFQTYDFTRSKAIRDLGKIFSLVRLTIRYQSECIRSPHVDCSTADITEVDDQKLFGGRRIRILDSRRASGTYLFERDDIEMKNPWETPLHSPLFIGGGDWGKGRGLLHSEPNFLAGAVSGQRVVDVYDCFGVK